MSTKNANYDVAISFISQDESLALRLYEQLKEFFQVFVYSKKQEKVAGTEGLESFREVFRSRSCLVVVLYRDGWGETRWTRVEETAIKDRCFNDGWSHLLFVTLDKKSTLPKWLPETYIRLNYEDYGFEETIGVIKARVQALGGTLKKLDALEKAKLLEQELKFRKEKERIFSSEEGVQALTQEARTLYTHIALVARNIKSETELEFKLGFDDFECVLTHHRVSLAIIWILKARNSLKNASLEIREINGRVLLPEERGKFLIRNTPEIKKEHIFQPDLTPSRGWRWRDAKNSDKLFNSKDLAEHCVSIFLNLIDKTEKGESHEPNIKVYTF